MLYFYIFSGVTGMLTGFAMIPAENEHMATIGAPEGSTISRRTEMIPEGYSYHEDGKIYLVDENGVVDREAPTYPV